MRILLLVLSLLPIGACSWLGFGERPEPPEPTLADLAPGSMPDTETPLPRVDLDTLVASYREVTRQTLQPQAKVQVLHRLADLELLRGEQQLYERQDARNVFQQAIDTYKQLLQEHPGQPGTDKVLYQLSKAYDLNGQPRESLQLLTSLVRQYPGSEHYPEAQFRRAEDAFADADYERAEQLYADVVEQGRYSAHYQNALYMHGWSLFKLDRFRAALKPFSLALDTLLPENYEAIELPRAQQELVNDSLRVMSVILSYLDGPQSIVEVYRGLGERRYEPLLYNALGELYLAQERYLDSAEAYRVFLNQYPNSDQAPELNGRLISVLEQGGFPDEVMLEKEAYVVRYDLDNAYWRNRYLILQDKVKPYLKLYLDELARYYHASAQELKKTEVEDDTLRQQNLALAQEHFARAAGFYQQYLDTFSDQPQRVEMAFLMAEAWFDAGQYLKAIPAYRAVAYEYPDNEHAAEAGYAVILCYENYAASGAGESATAAAMESEKIDAELAFAERFPQDTRAPAVLARAAQELLALQDYDRAIAAARKLTQWPAEVDDALLKTAWLVIGHASFELSQFAAAEQAYQRVLSMTPARDSTRKDLVERIAASVYKQGEVLLQQDDRIAAARQFLRVAEVAPDSDIRVSAQYDAAANLLQAEQWEQAIVILKDFRNRYRNHPLTQQIPERLVYAYLEQGDWPSAADELIGIYHGEPDAERKGEILYQAAELYLRAGDLNNAIEHFRTYAHGYPEPFALAMEARYQMSELYVKTQEPDKQRYWLRKMIEAHDEAASRATERSLYLAAFSSSILAEDAYQSFAQIRLSLRLKNSLKKKRDALDNALKALQKTADYGVAEFATMAAYKIGAVYTELSASLMASERPKNLDELALEQYEILLEEQAFPFEEQAIAIHEANAQRSWQGVYDTWVQRSFEALATLLPARYAKQERVLEVSRDIY